MRLLAPRDQSGLSLMSAVVGGFLLGVMVAIAVYSIVTSQKALGQGTTLTALDLEVSKILGRIVPELIVTGIDDPGNPNDSNLSVDKASCTDPSAVIPSSIFNPYIRFRKSAGAAYDAVSSSMQPLWSPDVEYWFEFASPANGYSGPAETSPVLDLNGNGLKGEGVIKRRQGGQTTIVGRNVLASSFGFVVDEVNNAVTVTFEVGGVIIDGKEAKVVTRKVSERIKLRN